MNIRRYATPFLLSLMGLLGALFILYGCGNDHGGEPPASSMTREVTVTISDPPICRAPEGNFTSVWVTITRVRAHLSSAAEDTDNGWVELVDLRDAPLQIDLLNTSNTTCVLTVLGSTTGLPPGVYQQLRLYLLSNNPAAGQVTPLINHCEDVDGFNCVELADGARQLLQLSSQARTGIKIPPGQIAGGAITLVANQAADINLDFNACDSIVQQGNGTLRLKPTLHAGEVASTSEAISGRVVDRITGEPLTDATIIVLAEQPDSSGVNRVIMQTLASRSDGTFILCPLPVGNYDIVIAASSDAGVIFRTTITFEVPTGTAIGDIPLALEGVPGPLQGAIEGLVTTSVDGIEPTGADVAVSAFQEVIREGDLPIFIAMPLFEPSLSNVATGGGGCPAGTKCATYVLIVPASNPLMGTFNPEEGTTYIFPEGEPVFYTISAQAFIPGSGSLPNCFPASLSTDLSFDTFTPLTVSPGSVSQAETLAFTGCEPGF